MNILFTNAGRRTYLIEYALDLINEGYDLNLFVSDTSINTAAMHVHSSVGTIITPRVSDDDEHYVRQLLSICKEKNIELLIPLMDFELPILSLNKTEFEKIGVKVWVSDYLTIINCLDKKLNYNFCINNGIPVPKSYFTNVSLKPPYIKKRILGSGSVGLEFVTSSLISDFKEGEDMIQEMVEGKEFGMDILNDINGNFVHSCVREKIEMRSGETDKASSLQSKDFEKWAKKISSTFKHVGNMDIDFILTEDKKIYFIDFNPRFGGGYPYTHLSGANYLKFIIESTMGEIKYKPELVRQITGFKGVKLFYKEN